MGELAAHRPTARSDDVVVERLPGETLVYDESLDRAHCLGGPAATVFDLCDGTRSRPELAALAAERLGRPFGEAELDPVLSELGATGLLVDDSPEDGVSRRRVLLAGGGIAAASLITTIVSPLPAAAQSPAPPGTPDPGSPGTACVTTTDCDEGLQCESQECCIPVFSEVECSRDSDCCGAEQNTNIQCELIAGTARLCVDNGGNGV